MTVSRLSIALLAGVMIASGCSRDTQGATAAPANGARGGAAAPVAVSTAPVVTKPMTVKLRSVGNVEASSTVEVRPQVSELDPTLSITIAGTSVPGFRERFVDTGVELKFGQTLAIAGLLQQRLEAEKRGIPYLMDLPYVGAAFRRNRQRINEVELLIMVTPHIVREGM